MDIRHLKVFIEVADTGKMSSAAENLFVSQPTVSQTIRELEDYYEILLFQRLSKRLHITPEGEKLLEHAKALVNKFENLEKEMFLINSLDEIKIGATITVGNQLISNVINKIEEKIPNIKTYAYVNNTKSIERKILDSELDIGIIEGEVTDPKLISIPTINDYLVLVCNNEHEFSNKKNIDLFELEGMDFVMREKGSGTRKLFEDCINREGVTINTKWETNCPGSMKSAVINNGFLAVLSIRLIEEEFKNGLIKVIPLSENPWQRSLSLVYHKDKVIDETMEKIIKVIEEYKEFELIKEVWPIKFIV